MIKNHLNTNGNFNGFGINYYLKNTLDSIKNRIEIIKPVKDAKEENNEALKNLKKGQKLGIMSSNEALDIAFEKKLDLVLVAPNGNPPVCKIMNYGKYKFEQAKKEKEAKKKQKVSEVKEIRITPNTEEHDFNFKAKNARKFLEDGCKVKITGRFRGRELNYAKAGEDLLNKFAEELSDISNLDKKPSLEGKNMFILLSSK